MIFIDLSCAGCVARPRLQPRSLFIGVAHTAQLSPAWCRLVPARLWEQPLTQEKNNGGIVQKIRSSPGLTQYFVLRIWSRSLLFVNLLNRKTHHDAMMPLPKTVSATVACLQTPSLRSGQDKVSAGCLTASAGSWDWWRGHMS